MPETVPAAAALVIQAPDIGTPQIKHLARLAQADTVSALTAAQNQAFRLTPARAITRAARPGPSSACTAR